MNTTTLLSTQLSLVLKSTLNVDIQALELLNSQQQQQPIVEEEEEEEVVVVVKSLIENRRIQMYNQVCSVFQVIQNSLDDVDKELQMVQHVGECLAKGVYQLKQQSNRLISDADLLSTQKNEILHKGIIINSFLKKFALDNDERKALEDAKQLTGEFFRALQKLNQAHLDTKTLENNEVGMDIAEQISRLLNVSYDKVYRWTLETIVPEFSRESPEISTQMQDSMKALRNKRELLQNILDEITMVRRTCVARSFNIALKHGGPMEQNKPLEMNANDFPRFTGDMLAWVHQTTCNEREMLQQLLSSTKAEEEDEDDIPQLLDRILEGICRPLRIRLDQIFSELESSVGESFRIANIIQFYSELLQRVIMNNQKQQQQIISIQLLSYLNDLTTSAFKVFYECLNSQASLMLKSIQTPQKDLLPPQNLRQFIHELKDLMSYYDSSLTLPLSPSTTIRGNYPFERVCDKEEGFETILNMYTYPLLQMCFLSSERLSSPFDQYVFMLNCMYTIHSCLCLYPTFTRKRLQLIEAQIQVQIDQLSQHEYQWMLKQSELSKFIPLPSQPLVQPLSMYDGYDATTINIVLSGVFDSFISNLNLELNTHLTSITCPKYANVVCKKSLQLFIDAYRQLYNAVVDPKNAYEFPLTKIFIRSISDVETLLSIK